MDHASANVGQTELAALKKICQFLMVDAEKVENRCLQIVHVDTSLNDVEAIVIGHTM